jgi:hypothetical protein
MPKATDPDNHSQINYKVVSYSDSSYVTYDTVANVFTFSSTDIAKHLEKSKITINARDGDTTSSGTDGWFEVVIINPGKYSIDPTTSITIMHTEFKEIKLPLRATCTTSDLKTCSPVSVKVITTAPAWPITATLTSTAGGDDVIKIVPYQANNRIVPGTSIVELSVQDTYGCKKTY